MGVPSISPYELHLPHVKLHADLRMAAKGMSLDLYTSNSNLTHKAKFWCNYVGALKGSQDLRAPEEAVIRTMHPSIVETLPRISPTSSTSSPGSSPRCSTGQRDPA